MSEGWTCWYCGKQNSDDSLFCDGSCDNMPVYASLLRGLYASTFPDNPQYYTLDDCVKALQKHGVN